MHPNPVLLQMLLRCLWSALEHLDDIKSMHRNLGDDTGNNNDVLTVK
jgi:hypothetical protein